MQLLQTVLFQRRVLQWLVPLVSLWVAVICGLAFSSAAGAEAEARSGNPTFIASRPPIIAAPAVYSIQASTVQDIDPASRPISYDPAPYRDIDELVVDSDSAIDVLPTRAHALTPETRLFVDGSCQTPMSLMLHSSFGAERMQQLARQILIQGLKTTTYREVTEILRNGDCPSSNSIIVSLDDFGTDWLRPHFQSMIRVFTERGFRMVVAVNVHGAQDPDAWTYLREIEALGNEVANHTIDHLNLARLAPNQVRWQVKGAHQIICVNLGQCPETLILPFGINDVDGIVLEAAAGYSYVVGIPGGREFGGESPFYLGRIGPHNIDQRATLNELAVSFGQLTAIREELIALRTAAGRGCSAGPSPSTAMPLPICLEGAAAPASPGPTDSRAPTAGPPN